MHDGTAAAVLTADLVDSTTSGAVAEVLKQTCTPCVGKATVYRLSLHEDVPCTDEPALLMRFT